ncbi:hypothetical protein E5206_06210 [Arthrobacter sp. PAMC25564]|uniref:hypothetical protein n=1 Tax=Arthrobacter sp. PAMC25564 TaxID=2565366 RepID=UPI0010A268F6|nr:hypothetical protein [Arthrobacter sp. PAMC25564]QCB96570.1 hypothetical protein E5206_06210 [Arthrobacter sp. PAMC25564]
MSNTRLAVPAGRHDPLEEALKHGYTMADEVRRTARRRFWRMAQYVGLALLAAAAGSVAYLALIRQH